MAEEKFSFHRFVNKDELVTLNNTAKANKYDNYISDEIIEKVENGTNVMLYQNVRDDDIMKCLFVLTINQDMGMLSMSLDDFNSMRLVEFKPEEVEAYIKEAQLESTETAH